MAFQAAHTATGITIAATAPEGVWLGDGLMADAAALGGDVLSVGALSLIAMLQRRFAPMGHTLFGAAGLEGAFPADGMAIRNASWSARAVPGEEERLTVSGPIATDLALASHHDRHRSYVEAVSNTAATTALRLCDWPEIAADIEVDARPVVAALFHAGLHLHLNRDVAAMSGKVPALILTGIESPVQARLWNDILLAAGEELDLPPGAIGVILAIEGQNAAFRAEELVFELKDHLLGVTTGNDIYLPVLASLGQKRQVPVLAGGNVTADRLADIRATVPGDEQETILAAFADA